ncbi:uncharacterized protein G2W53_010435 [Senna tora]|uniref:Uncharacterized protein n=1 Tax=Senna tora TaxID=362788 RepID=A0A835CBD2_9FABA|nr:uncharacterized protein G2W53_010435 [Senna tora]
MAEPKTWDDESGEGNAVYRPLKAGPNISSSQ